LSQESRLICCIKINLVLPTIISWCSTSNVTQYVYQTPSGDVLIVVKNVYYLIDFPSFNVKSGYNGQSIENLGIPKGNSYLRYKCKKLSFIKRCECTKGTFYTYVLQHFIYDREIITPVST
jgi:hypothetical protein